MNTDPIPSVLIQQAAKYGRLWTPVRNPGGVVFAAAAPCLFCSSPAASF
jgi:hypothetical protein